MKKQLAVFGLTTLLIGGAGTALAFGGAKGHHGCDRDGMGGPMAALTQLEGLTEAQKAQLRKIRSAARDAMRDMRDEMQDNRDELRDAMRDNADLATIRGLAERQGEQIASSIVLRAEIRDKIEQVLTESQREQLRDLRFSGKGFGESRHGMGF